MSKMRANLEVCLVNFDKVSGQAAWREFAVSICSRAEIHIWHGDAVVPRHTAIYSCFIAEVLHLQEHTMCSTALVPEDLASSTHYAMVQSQTHQVGT